MDPVAAFSIFLSNHGIAPISTETTIQQFIEANFSLMREDILKSVVMEALSQRDKNLEKGMTDSATLLGVWGVIIDTMKETIINRRESAEKNFQKLIEFGMEGKKGAAETHLLNLVATGYVDYLFLGILDETMNACKAENKDEPYFMFEYFKQFITESQNNHNKINTSNINTSLKYSSPEKVITSTTPRHDNDVTPASNEEILNEQDLLDSFQLLTKIMDECKGNANILKEYIIKECANKIDNGPSITTSAFSRVLQDNINACQSAGYHNKLKVLLFIKDLIKQYSSSNKISIVSGLDTDELGTINHHLSQLQLEDNTAQAIAQLNAHHAPQFIGDDADNKMVNRLILAPDSFIDGSKVDIQGKVKNKKNKKEKKLIKSKVHSLVDEISEQLDQNGWAVVDNFVPIELIKRVKIEAKLFQKYYEQSEIWVGKQADLGAHLKVPSVRGDRVLWLCGGHNTAPESQGVTRVIKTIGEIEPCKLEVKASAPIRRFAAIKELVAASDKLVEELKLKVEKLSGIFERSDAMLANYPGKGARFANHIDNTTGDGRRLTVLIYLNPDWDSSNGGALRITPPHPNADSVDVFPNGSRLALFYSAEIMHEVLPTYDDRYAITIWYYDVKEREAALLAAKESGKGSAAAVTSIESQIKAKEFISELMGGDEIDESGGEPTVEELQLLAAKVTDLSDESLGIVANITGSPSVQSFRAGFSMLVPEDLKSMRRLFRRMGLQ
eukprot:gene9498-12795_t